MKNEDLKTAGRILLGVGLIFAGVSHLTFARKEFQAVLSREFEQVNSSHKKPG